MDLDRPCHVVGQHVCGTFCSIFSMFVSYQQDYQLGVSYASMSNMMTAIMISMQYGKGIELELGFFVAMFQTSFFGCQCNLISYYSRVSKLQEWQADDCSRLYNLPCYALPLLSEAIPPVLQVVKSVFSYLFIRCSRAGSRDTRGRWGRHQGKLTGRTYPMQNLFFVLWDLRNLSFCTWLLLS